MQSSDRARAQKGPAGVTRAGEPGEPSRRDCGSVELSIVIPSYDRRDALERCLRALCRCVGPELEVIVVDDGSGDGTMPMLEELRESEPRLRLRWKQNLSNRGANHSRNRGIRGARGRWIAFLDSDCLPAADWPREIMAPFDDPRVGAVTGLVVEDEPRNAFELTLWGMNRVHGDGDAGRLVAGNLCVRREFLVRFPFDEDLKYGCDEEGLFLRLRQAGIRQVFAAAAIVQHVHRFDARRFFRQAWRGGVGAAWFVYKFRLWGRLDVTPLILSYATLPLAILDPRALLLPSGFMALQIAALLYADVFRKGKSLWSSIATLPLLLAYYHVRVAAYVAQSLRLRLGGHEVERVSRVATGGSS